MTVSLRPEAIHIVTDAAPSGWNTLEGSVGTSMFLGETAELEVRVAETRLRVLELHPRVDRPIRAPISLAVDPADVVILLSLIHI